MNIIRIWEFFKTLLAQNNTKTKLNQLIHLTFTHRIDEIF